MMRCAMLLFAATLVSLASLGNGQPVSCLEEGHCRDGLFCDMSVFMCRKCLSCSGLKRRQPASPSSCIQSVRDCGACLEGFVPDPQGDINCVVPSDKTTSSASGDTNMTIIWVCAGIFIALLFIAAVAVMYRYVCKHQSWIKFNVDTNIGATLPAHVVATAPECPPPPYSPPHLLGNIAQTDEDTSRPLIKPYQPPFPAVEAQDLQNVSVYNPPSYVRLNNGLRQPDAYMDVPNANDENDNHSPLGHDEDTTPSPWVPSNNYSNNNAGVGAALNLAVGDRGGGSSETAPASLTAPSDFSAALAIARSTDLIQPPPVTLRLQPLTGNDESSSGEENSHQHHGGAGGASRGSRGGTGAVNVMNVNQIFNIIKPPL